MKESGVLVWCLAVVHVFIAVGGGNGVVSTTTTDEPSTKLRKVMETTTTPLGKSIKKTRMTLDEGDDDLHVEAPDMTVVCGLNIRNMWRVMERGSTDKGEAGTKPPATPPSSLNRSLAGIKRMKTDSDWRLVGGITAEKNAYPWIALLGRKTHSGMFWFCGGSLINQQWVLTAAHCLRGGLDVVRLGEYDYDTSDGAMYEDFAVETIIPHPKYQSRFSYHDLGLVKLSQKAVRQPYIMPICLPWPPEHKNIFVGKPVTVACWGATSQGGSPTITLQEVKLTVFHNDVCEKSYSHQDTNTGKWPHGLNSRTLCIGYIHGGRDACQGDSGGPLMSMDETGRYVQDAVVSQGYGCAQKEYPGLNVNLRHLPYLAWIKKVAFS